MAVAVLRHALGGTWRWGGLGSVASGGFGDDCLGGRDVSRWGQDAAGEPACTGAVMLEAGVDLVGREPGEVLGVETSETGGGLRPGIFLAEQNLVPRVRVDRVQQLGGHLCTVLVSES